MTADEKLDRVLGELGAIREHLAAAGQERKDTRRRVSELERDTDSLGGRVSVLERWRYTMIGAAAGLGMVGDVIIRVVARA